MYLFKKNSIFFVCGLASLGCSTPAQSSHRAPASDAAPQVCNILDYGALADGVTDNTKAIQSAVASCENTGGTVLVPAGKFVTGTITLGSNMTLKIDPAGTLFGTSDVNAYPVLTPKKTKNGQLLNCRKALIFADGVSHLTIDGGGTGTINGNGAANNWKGNQIKEFLRPMAIFIVESSGVNLQNLKVVNGATWAVVSMENQNVRIGHFNVDTRMGITHDGIDIVDGSDIVLDDVTVASGDDAICLKSGVASGLHDVSVLNSNIVSSQTNGLKFGTASVGPLTNIVFDNITINNVGKAAMAIESVDGSKISDITFQNIQFHHAATAFFVILGWRGDQTKPNIGSISGIHFNDITGDTMTQVWGSGFSGTELNSQVSRINDITFDNVNVTFKGGLNVAPPQPPEYFGQYPDPDQLNQKSGGNLPASGLYFRHAKGISIQPNCKFTTAAFGNAETDVRPVIEHSQDAQGTF